MPNWITDQIAVGGAGITRETWPELADRHRFTAVLSLRSEFQDVFGPPLPAAYLWLPVTDHTDPPPEQLLIGTQFIAAAVRTDQRVLVHCKMGIGRSPTMVAAYLVWSGQSLNQAIYIVTQATSTGLTRSVISQFTLEKFADYLKRKQ